MYFFMIIYFYAYLMIKSEKIVKNKIMKELLKNIKKRDIIDYLKSINKYKVIISILLSLFVIMVLTILISDTSKEENEEKENIINNDNDVSDNIMQPLQLIENNITSTDRPSTEFYNNHPNNSLYINSGDLMNKDSRNLVRDIFNNNEIEFVNIVEFMKEVDRYHRIVGDSDNYLENKKMHDIRYDKDEFTNIYNKSADAVDINNFIASYIIFSNLLTADTVNTKQLSEDIEIMQSKVQVLDGYNKYEAMFSNVEIVDNAKESFKKMRINRSIQIDKTKNTKLLIVYEKEKSSYKAIYSMIIAEFDNKIYTIEKLAQNLPYIINEHADQSSIIEYVYYATLSPEDYINMKYGNSEDYVITIDYEPYQK